MIQQWTDVCNTLYVAKEVGAEGTPHLQGYVTFKGSRRLGGLKKLQSRAHWEPAKGSRLDSFKY